MKRKTKINLNQISPQNKETKTTEFPGLVPVDNDELETPTFDIEVKDESLGVDLRELYCELGSKKDFSAWVSSKISQFVEGEGFVIIPQSGDYSGRGRPRKDYAVSVDCAKHIAMMEQTERGRQVRRYFIECERRLREQSSSTGIQQSYIEAQRAHLKISEKSEEQAGKAAGGSAAVH